MALKVATFHSWECPWDCQEDSSVERIGIDLIVPLGPQRHAQDDVKCTEQQDANHFIQWRWRRLPLVNQSAGLHIALGRQF